MTRWTTALALILAAGAPGALAQETFDDNQPEHGDRPSAAPVVSLRQPAGQASVIEASQPAAERAPDAVEFLGAVSDTLDDGFAATARSTFAGESSMGNIFAESEGRWTNLTTDEDGWAARYVGVGTPSMTTEQFEFDIVWTAESVRWIDHENSVLYARPMDSGRKAGKTFQLATNCWDRMSSLADSFAGTLRDAAGLELIGTEEIDGVECEVLAITHKAGADAVYWYFGVEDYLPRRCELRLPENPMINGAMRVDFIDPVAGAGVVDSTDFELYTPDGYTEDISRALGGGGAQVNADDDEGLLNRSGVRTNPDAAAPEWEVVDTEGVAVSPGSLRGKVAVLYFWGTWSAPAKKATPGVAQLVEDYEGQPVEVISMAFRESDAGAVAPAAAAQGQTWRLVPEADSAAELLSVRLAPSFVVLGKEGELLFKSGRPAADYTETFTRMRAIIDQALLEEAGGEEAKGSPSSADGVRLPVRSAPTRVTRPKVIRDDG